MTFSKTIQLAIFVIAILWLGTMMERLSAAPASSQVQPVDMATTITCEDQTHTICRTEFQGGYEAIAASQTDQVMGGTGATGDLLHAITCSFSAAPGSQVTVKDGAGSAISVMTAAGADAKTVLFDMVSTSGAWKISTGTNTTCIGIGRFT